MTVRKGPSVCSASVTSSKQRKPQSCFSPKESSVWSWHLLSGLDAPHAGKEETHKGQEMLGHKNACVCRRQGILLFSQCPMCQWKKEGQNEKHPSPLSPTYYIPRGNRGKAETENTFAIEFATSLHSCHG